MGFSKQMSVIKESRKNRKSVAEPCMEAFKESVEADLYTKVDAFNVGLTFDTEQELDDFIETTKEASDSVHVVTWDMNEKDGGWTATVLVEAPSRQSAKKLVDEMIVLSTGTRDGGGESQVAKKEARVALAHYSFKIEPGEDEFEKANNVFGMENVTPLNRKLADLGHKMDARIVDIDWVSGRNLVSVQASSQDAARKAIGDLLGFYMLKETGLTESSKAMNEANEDGNTTGESETSQIVLIVMDQGLIGEVVTFNNTVKGEESAEDAFMELCAENFPQLSPEQIVDAVRDQGYGEGEKDIFWVVSGE